MRTIDADYLKAGFDEDGHLSPYIEGFINSCPTVGTPLTIANYKDAALEIYNLCRKHRTCGKCPLFDEQLKCRVNHPFEWWIDDWRKEQ